MRQNKAKFPKGLFAIAVVAPLAIGLTACGRSESPVPEPPSPPPPTSAYVPATHASAMSALQATSPPAETAIKKSRERPIVIVGTAEAPPQASAIRYSAKIIAPSSLTASQSGNASVYVGRPNYFKHVSVSSAETASKTVPLLTSGGIYKSAEVALTGNGFTITPVIPPGSTRNCYGLGEYGSQYDFTITPRKNDKSGPYQLNAHVWLYQEAHCVGTPLGRSAQPVTVTVQVESLGEKEREVITNGF